MTNRYASDAISMLADAKRRFPGCEVAVYPFAALWPIYDATLTVTALTPHELSTTARFILRLVNLGVSQPFELARTLGLSEDYAAVAAADLLKAGHVVQQPDKAIALTDLGLQTLNDRGRSFVPQSHYLNVAYDPIIGEVADIDGNRLQTMNQARQRGEFVMPANHRKPRLANFRMDAVKAAAARNPYFNESEITQITSVRNPKPKYRSDLTLLGMREPGSDRLIFSAYRGRRYMENQSEAVRRLADNGADLTPQEANPESAKAWVDAAAMPAQERERLSNLVDLSERVGKMDTDIAVEREFRRTVEDQRERAESSARIEKLESEKRDLENRLAQAERQLEQDSQGELRLLETEDHRPVLLRAINEAQSELTLVSAWIMPRAFDNQIRRGIANAIRRGATVRIAWGMPIDQRRQSEGDRNRDIGLRLIRQLRDMIPNRLRHRLVDELAGTHQKFIICDDKFCAAGSFNWLSYRGEIDDGYRTESSLYSESANIIDLYKAQAESIFA